MTRAKGSTRQRSDEEKAELRQLILDTSAQLFLQSGYEHFSLRHVAEQIGYSPGTLYLYFKDKDDLLFHVVANGFLRFQQHLEMANLSSSDTQDRLASVARAYITFGLRNPMYYQLMFIQRPEFLLKPSRATSKPHINAFEILHTLVQQAMDEHIFRTGDVQTTSDVLWGLLHGIVSLAILLPQFDQQRIHGAVEGAIEMVREGIHLS